MKLAMQDKIIAAILIVHSLLGILWIYIMANQFSLGMLFVLPNLVLAVSGITAGVGSFLRQRWAAILGILFFAIQVLQISDPSFQFSFTLGLNLNISLGWFREGELGINLIALAMLIWSGVRCKASNYAIKGTSV